MKAATTYQIMLLLILVPLLVSNVQADPPHCETLGAWSEPVNLGPPINTDANEASATFSRNGLSLYFTSNRLGGQLNRIPNTRERYHLTPPSSLCITRLKGAAQRCNWGSFRARP